MGKVIADPAVRIVPIPQTRPSSPASRIDTEMYRVMERVARTIYPGAAVLPSMSTAASDQAQLRAKGIRLTELARPQPNLTRSITRPMETSSALPYPRSTHSCRTSGLSLRKSPRTGNFST